MKKIVCLFLGMLMIGCTVQNDGNNNASTTSSSTITTAPVVTTITTTTVPEYNYPKPEYHDQIMNGDFSSIAGEFVNPNGDIVVLDDKGLRKGEKSGGKVYYINGMYQMGISPENSEYGYTLSVYPVGLEVTVPAGNVKVNVESNTSKIRISYGQSYPSSDEIYQKKED